MTIQLFQLLWYVGGELHEVLVTHASDPSKRAPAFLYSFEIDLDGEPVTAIGTAEAVRLTVDGVPNVDALRLDPFHVVSSFEESRDEHGFTPAGRATLALYRAALLTYGLAFIPPDEDADIHDPETGYPFTEGPSRRRP